MSKEAVLWKVLSDREAQGHDLGILDLREGKHGHGRLLRHVTYPKHDEHDMKEAFFDIYHWAKANDYEIVDEKIT